MQVGETKRATEYRLAESRPLDVEVREGDYARHRSNLGEFPLWIRQISMTARPVKKKTRKPLETGWRHVTYMTWGYTKLISSIALKFLTHSV